GDGRGSLLRRIEMDYGRLYAHSRGVLAWMLQNSLRADAAEARHEAGQVGRAGQRRPFQRFAGSSGDGRERTPLVHGEAFRGFVGTKDGCGKQDSNGTSYETHRDSLLVG